MVCHHNSRANRCFLNEHHAVGVVADVAVDGGFDLVGCAGFVIVDLDLVGVLLGLSAGVAVMFVFADLLVVLEDGDGVDVEPALTTGVDEGDEIVAFAINLAGGVECDELGFLCPDFAGRPLADQLTGLLELRACYALRRDEAAVLAVWCDGDGFELVLVFDGDRSVELL